MIRVISVLLVIVLLFTSCGFNTSQKQQQAQEEEKALSPVEMLGIVMVIIIIGLAGMRTLDDATNDTNESEHGGTAEPQG